MKIKKLARFRKVALLAMGVVLGRGAYADTLLTFEGTANNLTIPQSYGDFAASSTAGVIVTGNGTPDINVGWSASGTGSPCEWQFYTYYAWAPGVGQLNDCNQNNSYDVTFTPTGTASVVLNSFSFAPYYNNSRSYDFNWTVLQGATVLTNGSTHLVNVSGKAPIDITGTT